MSKDLSGQTPTFRKSSFSPVQGGGGPACVEVAHNAGGVLVRDSKDPHHTLQFTVAEWDAFLKGAKAGEFD